MSTVARNRKTLGVNVSQHELRKIEADAAGKPIATYLRELLGLPPAQPKGRRWPADPAQRQWRRTA
jgi:hypothetical protein